MYNFLSHYIILVLARAAIQTELKYFSQCCKAYTSDDGPLLCCLPSITALSSFKCFPPYFPNYTYLTCFLLHILSAPVPKLPLFPFHFTICTISQLFPTLILIFVQAWPPHHPLIHFWVLSISLKIFLSILSIQLMDFFASINSHIHSTILQLCIQSLWCFHIQWCL